MYTYNVKEGNRPDAAAESGTTYDRGTYTTHSLPAKTWSPFEQSIFRITFVFFSILIVPWHPDFYRQLFSVNWLKPHFKHLLDLITFLPGGIATSRWGAGSFVNWGLFLFIAVVAGYVWGVLDKPAKEYTLLRYLLRVAIRYKVGLGLVACGFYLFFQQQMPYPSLSNLHTNYGDLFAWKLYFQTTAINPAYQSFLGFVEILTGLLLIYRRTVTLGAGLLIGFISNVAMVNFFYDVGHHLYVMFLLLSAGYLISYDVPRLYTLLVKSRKSLANRFYPDWNQLKLRGVRHGLRITALLLLVLTGARAYALTAAPFKIPQSPGIPGAYGYYIPTLFRINDRVIPYSVTDPDRWQDVIFEKWSTMTIKVNRPIIADISDGDVVTSNDIDRNYETAGSGGRHYFHYELNTAAGIIRAQNKNIHHRDERWDLAYSFPTDSTMILRGVNERNDSLYTELLRIDKKYFMYEGRRSSIKL